jgi:hypothetical protein
MDDQSLPAPPWNFVAVLTIQSVSGTGTVEASMDRDRSTGATIAKGRLRGVVSKATGEARLEASGGAAKIQKTVRSVGDARHGR